MEGTISPPYIVPLASKETYILGIQHPFTSTITECKDVFNELELEQYLPHLVSNPRNCLTMRVEIARYKRQAKKKVLKTSQE